MLKKKIVGDKSMRIAISAETTADLTKELIEEYESDRSICSGDVLE